jgi:hypothetical protein
MAARYRLDARVSMIAVALPRPADYSLRSAKPRIAAACAGVAQW